MSAKPETLIRRGLSAIRSELHLLRCLEIANRNADPFNCPKSLNEKSALRALDDFRAMGKKR